MVRYPLHVKCDGAFSELMFVVFLPCPCYVSRWSDVTRMLRVMEHCALESSERQHYAMVVAMLQGRYDDSDAWPIAEQFIRSLRVSYIARCMQ